MSKYLKLAYAVVARMSSPLLEVVCSTLESPRVVTSGRLGRTLGPPPPPPRLPSNPSLLSALVGGQSPQAAGSGGRCSLARGGLGCSRILGASRSEGSEGAAARGGPGCSEQGGAPATGGGTGFVQGAVGAMDVEAGCLELGRVGQI
jgi:hypothetical protein